MIGRSLFKSRMMANRAAKTGAGKTPPARVMGNTFASRSALPAGAGQMQAQQVQQSRMASPPTPAAGPQRSIGMPVGTPVFGMKAGGKVTRGDGCCMKGKTKGAMK